jgi:hypothetical protein
MSNNNSIYYSLTLEIVNGVVNIDNGGSSSLWWVGVILCLAGSIGLNLGTCRKNNVSKSLATSVLFLLFSPC